VTTEKFLMRYSMALENANTGNEFTEIEPVLARKEVSKKRRTQTIEILLELPSLITGI
jgi:hypothetical protein